MSYGLLEEGEEINELGDLESLFNVKREPDAGNPKGAGEKAGKLTSRDLNIVKRVDERYAEIVKSSQKPQTEALEDAFVFVEEDIKDKPDAIQPERIKAIYEEDKEFSDQINKEEEEKEEEGRIVVFNDDLSWRKREFRFLKSLLARITKKSQSMN